MAGFVLVPVRRSGRVPSDNGANHATVGKHYLLRRAEDTFQDSGVLYVMENCGPFDRIEVQRREIDENTRAIQEVIHFALLYDCIPPSLTALSELSIASIPCNKQQR